MFDNIYVINLKESTDRREHIENEFKRVGIDKYEIFEATPHYSEEVKKITQSDLVKKFPGCFRCGLNRCDCGNNFLTPFQIGNWCSFLRLFQDIIDKNYNFVLICEDDIKFSNQYERIINKLLSKHTFATYKIKMNRPLLIRLGTAYNPANHESPATPIFLRNYSLCNPCFAINREMAIVYLKYLKIITHTSDVYFHQIIPKKIPGIQYFTMYPYPIYELSFVKSKQKFESQVRPNNGLRRVEYKEFLFLSSNFLLHAFCIKLVNQFKNIMDIKTDSIGINGNIDYYLLMKEETKRKFYFQNKILIEDNDEENIKILEKYKNMNIYKGYINKINELYNNSEDSSLSLSRSTSTSMSITTSKSIPTINLSEQSVDVDKELDTDSNIKQFYEDYKRLLYDSSIIRININNIDDINKLSHMCKPNKLQNLLFDYFSLKNKILSNI
jgi:GR25 family glycosyltransferase involved in LPS biosynthesis